MGAVKSNVKIDAAVKEQASPVAQTHKEQLLDIIKRKKIPRRTVDINSEGHIIADKAKDPELYDWAVNG